VTEVAAGRRAIEFSGAVEQVESAFRTRIGQYLWNGVRHTANASDISIPEALAPVVAGVVSLHDFGPRALHHVLPARGVSPETNFSGGVHGLSPYDFATIYDVLPLWNAGLDGTGQSLAIVGETNIKVSDVTSFRATFGLPVNNPQIILNGKDPGILSGEETEADLDIEWAGAVARGATIKFVTSASTSASDGVTLSAQYIVSHNVAPVMSLSYGLCEAQMGSSNAFYSSLWKQASAQGIAVFVAAGDSGSAGCDTPYSSGSGGKNTTRPASLGYGINGLASTPYNVAVGGTEFNDTASPSTYWKSTNASPLASATGYIPEVAWNESSYTSGASGNSLYAGGGGASIEWPRPSWQTGMGVTGAMRQIPDVSLTAAGHDGYVVEQEGGLYLVSGTSASTPSFAGLMAIVNQSTRSTNGNPNGTLYGLASTAPSVYHDITAGTNAVPCTVGSPNCSSAGKMNGYNAAAGYDMATGWGSVDANLLVRNWGGTPPPTAAPSIASLSPNPMTASAAIQTLTISGSGFATSGAIKVTVGASSYQVAAGSSSQLSLNIILGPTAQTLAVQVTNPTGAASNSVNLTVNAPVAPPAIASLTPNPMTASNSAQTLTINGSGFLPGLTLRIGSTAIGASQLASLSATTLTVNVITGLTPYTYAVQVVNSNGAASNSVNLQVNAPPTPVIVSLSPNPLSGSSALQTLTINGGNFQSGTGLKVVVGSTAYSGSQVTFVSASQLNVTLVIAAGAKTLGVQVTNPSGLVSNTASLAVH
jgi:subtilase family serine protease